MRTALAFLTMSVIMAFTASMAALTIFHQLSFGVMIVALLLCLSAGLAAGGALLLFKHWRVERRREATERNNALRRIEVLQNLSNDLHSQVKELRAGMTIVASGFPEASLSDTRQKSKSEGR